MKILMKIRDPVERDLYIWLVIAAIGVCLGFLYSAPYFIIRPDTEEWRLGYGIIGNILLGISLALIFIDFRHRVINIPISIALIIVMLMRGIYGHGLQIQLPVLFFCIMLAFYAGLKRFSMRPFYWVYLVCLTCLLGITIYSIALNLIEGGGAIYNSVILCLSVGIYVVIWRSLKDRIY